MGKIITLEDSLEFIDFLLHQSQRMEHFLNLADSSTFENLVAVKHILTVKLKKDLALEIIKEKPVESGDCINYITINKNNSNMLDYKHYCMTIKVTLAEEEFNTLKEVLI